MAELRTSVGLHMDSAAAGALETAVGEIRKDLKAGKSAAVMDKKLAKAEKAAKAIKDNVREGANKLPGEGEYVARVRAVAAKRKHQTEERIDAKLARQAGQRKRASQSGALADLTNYVERRRTSDAGVQRPHHSPHKSAGRSKRPKAEPEPKRKNVAAESGGGGGGGGRGSRFSFSFEPANTVEYTSLEAATLLAELDRPYFGEAIEAMVTHDPPLVPVGAKRLYALRTWAKLNPGQNPRAWGAEGRPPKMSVEQADGIAPALTGSASADKVTVVDTVKALEVARRAEAGLSNLGKSGISAASEERYLALAATAPQAKIVEATFSKPEARRIAESSKMSAASLLVGMAVANYRVLGPREQLRWQPTVVEDELASLVSQANSGAKVQRVHPLLLYSIDDVGIQASQTGKPDPKTSKYFIINASADTSVRAATVPSGRASSSRGGFESKTPLKLTIAISAGGSYTDPFLIVPNLTEAELDPIIHPDGVAFLKIEDLNVGTSRPTTIAFVRSGSSTEGGLSPMALAVKHHYEEILIPHIQRARELYLGWDGEGPLDSHLFASTWYDGQMDAVEYHKSPGAIALTREHDIADPKQAASTTATAQAADLGKHHPRVHYLNKLLDPSMAAVSQIEAARVTKHLRSFLGLKLPKGKEVAVSNVSSALDSMLAQACTRRNLVSGFEANGMNDRSDPFSSNLEAVLDTCQAPWLPNEVDNIRQQFDKLYKEFSSEGVVSDATMLKHMIPEDEPNSKGIVRSRDTDHEPHRRVQITNHRALEAKRLAKVNEVAAEVAKLAATEKVTVEAILEVAVVAERKLIHLVEQRAKEGVVRRGQRPASTADAVLEDVVGLSVAELKAFDTARRCKTLRDRKPYPKRGTLEEAKDTNGKPTLARMAFELRKKEVILTVPTPTAPQPAPAAPSPNVSTVSMGIASNSSSDRGGGGGGGRAASVWAADRRWLKLMGTSFIGGAPDLAVPINGDHANELSSILHRRFKRHVEEHPQLKGKEDHWVLGWVYGNLPRAAAWLSGSGLIKLDLKRITDDSSLLRVTRVLRHHVTGPLRSASGAYIHVDTEHDDGPRAVRTGKANELGARNDKHADCSRLLNPEDLKSDFYNAYPDITSTRITEESFRGYFSYLTQCVAMAFDKTDKGAVKAICDTNPQRGLLSWPAAAMTHISALKFKGAEEGDKQLNMVGYFWELVFHLAIAPGDSVSKSPGFETPLGIYPKH